jgi:hypothetical protein
MSIDAGLSVLVKKDIERAWTFPTASLIIVRFFTKH